MITPKAWPPSSPWIRRGRVRIAAGRQGRGCFTLKKPKGLDAANREIVREGLNEFRLHDKRKAGQDGDLIFERHGLSWKLAKIQASERFFGSTAG